MTIRLLLADAPAPAGSPNVDTLWTLSLPRRRLNPVPTPADALDGEPAPGRAAPD
jgi:hypothetical protein